jgi:transposase
MAISFIMVLCLLVYRLAEVRLRTRLAQTRAFHSQPSPQTDGTSHHAALVLQCLEGIELLHIQTATTSRILVLRLQPLHRLILQPFGPLYGKFYLLSG